MATRIALIVAMLAVIGIPAAVEADAAPPQNPRGSSILPAGQTMVRMVAESVTIAVEQSATLNSPVAVTAAFAMRNEGAATESMNVRFPLEDPNGMGDGYGRRPMIVGFKANAGKDSLPISFADESLNGGPPAKWAVFPVTFPPGVDRLITVSYSLLLSTAADGTEQAEVAYIFETGAGWYGAIGSAVLTLRLPYAASASNVYLSDPWNPQKVPPPVFVGREVRWEWQNFEPTFSDNLSVVFVWPKAWSQVLSLEAQAGQDPSNEHIAIQLAETYRRLGSERHGMPISDPLYRLAIQTVNLALPYAPSSSALSWEMWVIEAWKCTGFPKCDASRVDQLLYEYKHLPELTRDLQPQDLDMILFWLNEVAPSDATPRPTRTPTDIDAEVAPQAPASALPTAPAGPTSPAPVRTSPRMIEVPVLLTGFLIAIAAIALLVARRARRHAP